jgi:uncharacterized membrane protein
MRGARDERGAILPMVALLLSVLMGASALAVDLGQLRVGRVDMQSLADVVSLDLARQIDGRQAQVIEADPVWSQARAQSVARNAGTYGEPPTVTARLGTFDTTAGAFTPASGATVPTAVQVTALTSVAFAFRSGGGTVARSAVAMADSTACFMLGSYAAAVRSGESALLSSVLGQINSSLDLGAVGYTGLLDANVNLADVAAHLGIGTVTQLAGSTVTVKALYLAMASALQTGGNAADAAVLSQLALSVATLGQVDVGKVLQADTATARGVDATVNAIDVVAGSAMLVNGSHAVTVPNLSTSVPGLLSATSSLSIVEAPQLACSRANPTPMREARTSQVSATVGGRLDDVTLAAIGTGITAGSPAGKPLGLTLSLASAAGHLTQVTCANPASAAPVPAHSITVATTSGLLAADLTIPLAVSGKIGVASLGLGLVSFTIGVDVKVSAASAAGQARSTTNTVPAQQFDTAYSAGSGSLSLAGGSVTRTGLTVSATLLGLPVTLPTATIDTILSGVVSTVVTPLVNQLDAAVVQPLANLTGTRIAGADVIALSKPHCSVPVLRQ